jgi:hypothetical protein
VKHKGGSKLETWNRAVTGGRFDKPASIEMFGTIRCHHSSTLRVLLESTKPTRVSTDIAKSSKSKLTLDLTEWVVPMARLHDDEDHFPFDLVDICWTQQIGHIGQSSSLPLLVHVSNRANQCDIIGFQNEVSKPRDRSQLSGSQRFCGSQTQSTGLKRDETLVPGPRAAGSWERGKASCRVGIPCATVMKPKFR